jgi:hypothetical protein
MQSLAVKQMTLGTATPMTLITGFNCAVMTNFTSIDAALKEKLTLMGCTSLRMISV